MHRTFGVLLALVTAAHAAPCPPPDVTSRAPSVQDGRLAFCAGPDEPCWVVDTATSTWIQRPSPPPATVEVTASKVRSCAPGGADCVEIETKAYADGGAGIANADRTLLAVWSGPALDVYDLVTKKRVTTIKGWSSPMGPAAGIQGAQFLGGVLAVWQSWSPVSSTARLFTARTGKRIGDVGKRGTEVEAPAVQIAGTRWAFGGFAPKLYIADVKTGAVKKTIALAGEHGTHLIAGTLPDGRIPVFSEQGVYVDPATGKATPFTAPACSK